MDENFHIIQKRNNSTNRNISNNNFFSKESVKVNSNMRLSDSNIELNIEEPKIKDLRCLNCYLIPFLTLNSDSHSININCNFGHSTSIGIEEYLIQGYDNNFNNLACSKCKTKILKNEKNYVYCKECSELLCKNCIKKHNNLYEDNHHMVNLDKFDTTCILHNETYDYFCIDCKKNICQYCFDEFHNEHRLVDLDDINLKRKEIKKIKENFLKEKENYLNIPKILNELIIKLKREIDMIVNNVKNEIKFKESIINTYENKIDNYNAIMNLKNLGFNAEPFIIDKNINILENLINLMKYLNMKENKIDTEKKVNLLKTPEKVKLKKKKEKLYNKPHQRMANANKVNNNINNINVNNNMDNNSNNKKDNNNNNANVIKDDEITNSQDINKENEKAHNKEINKDNNNNNKIYKKNFISKKINYSNSNTNINNKTNDNNINITNDINSGNNKKYLSKITEDESSNNQNINSNISNSKDIQDNTNKKEDLSIPTTSEIETKEKEKKIKNAKIEEEKDEKDIYNLVNNIHKQEENIKQNNNGFNKKKNINENNKNSKFTSNSTNNINYIRADAPNLKMAVKSNKKRYINKKIDLGKKQNKKINSQSQKILSQVSNNPFSIKNQFNKNNENINRQKNIIKNINVKQNNRKIKVEEDEDEETNEEEEEEEDEENEEEEEDEEDEDLENGEETEENEEEEKFVIKNKNMPMRRMNKNKQYNRMENDEQNNKELDTFENNDSSLKHKKKFPKSNISSDNNKSELFTNKKNKGNKNNVNNKDKENSNEKSNEQIRIVRDITVNEFRPNGSTLKIKESDNTVCCILEVRDNIFACGFLLGEIDVYDVNYLNCLFTIYEHKSRVSNMVLLKDKSLLTSSFDYTMKKIRITNNNSYIVDFIFNSFKNPVYKGIELTNNNIVSISFKGNINIFKKTDKNNNYLNFISHEIADEEIFNVIELVPNKEIAFSTDECLRFFSIDNYQNIGNVHLLEFAKGNNLIHISKNTLFVLLKHDIGMINISQRQCIFKCSLGEVGKPECFCYLKDNTILVGISNNQKENNKIEFLFKQFSIKMTKLKLIAEKMEIIDKKKKDDYCRITSLVELKNNVIAYGTAGFEEFKLMGNISIID